MAMMGQRLPARSGDEHDVVTRWPAKYLDRAGVRARVKRRMRRRERRDDAVAANTREHEPPAWHSDECDCEEDDWMYTVDDYELVDAALRAAAPLRVQMREAVQ